jgi:hypothetical protein
MNLGAEPKKIAILGGLLAVAGVALYMNVFQGDSAAPAATRPVAPVAVAAQAPVAAIATPVGGGLPDTRRREQKNNGVSEAKFRQGYARPEDKPDPATIDPTLRLDLLAKVQSVELESTYRNLFQYGVAQLTEPPIKLPEGVPVIPIKDRQPVTPPPSVKPGPPPVPQAPTMTFKYYGFKLSRKDGHKEAFLLDGEDIIIASENEAIKRGRYKVVRIGVGSIVIEDTEFKSTQTLQLQEDAAA